MKPEEEAFFKKVGMKIGKIRNQKGITQKDLATKVGCKQSYICSIENGYKSINAFMLAKIATCLDVPYDMLYKDTEENDFLTTLTKHMKFIYNSCPCDDITVDYLCLQIDKNLQDYLYKVASINCMPALTTQIRDELTNKEKQSFYNKNKAPKETHVFIPFPENQIVKDNTPPNRWDQFELLQLTNNYFKTLG